MPHDRSPAVDQRAPLFVDVDGTLIRADISLESFVRFARSGLGACVLLFLWLLRGRAFAKTMVARRCPIDPAKLPYRAAMLGLIAAARAENRPVILASASHWRNIARIARHLDIGTPVLATRGARNLKGRAKLAAIRASLPPNSAFRYAGDSRADICLWRAAEHGYTVGHIPTDCAVERIDEPRKPFWRVVAKAMRPHQWAKNALVAVPVFAAGLLFDPVIVAKAACAAVLMSLVASAIYLINDLLDIDADRAHHSKWRRPLAHGDLSIPAALILSTLLGSVSVVGAWLLGGLPLLAAFIAYIGLTTAYSFRIKAAMVADVIMLACLYTIRIWVGAVATGVHLTFWLLLFSVFLFLSLAYLKRYIELKDAIEPNRLLSGRGYVASDLDIVMMAGVAAGMVAILVLALFANAMALEGRYATPELLWLLCLPLLYWINRVWMMARRGEVEGDPVAFAIRDPRSIATGAAMAAIFIAAQKFSFG